MYVSNIGRAAGSVREIGLAKERKVDPAFLWATVSSFQNELPALIQPFETKQFELGIHVTSGETPPEQFHRDLSEGKYRWIRLVGANKQNDVFWFEISWPFATEVKFTDRRRATSFTDEPAVNDSPEEAR